MSKFVPCVEREQLLGTPNATSEWPQCLAVPAATTATQMAYQRDLCTKRFTSLGSGRAVNGRQYTAMTQAAWGIS